MARLVQGRLAADYPNPTPMKLKFIEGIEVGMTPNQAATYAGSADPVQYANVMTKTDLFVQQEMARIMEERRNDAKMTREKVQNIVLEAVDMAKTLAMPGDMIRGAAELNKMCGFYAPEQVNVNVEAKIRRVQTQFESLSDAELVELIGDKYDPIEAEFRRLENDE